MCDCSNPVKLSEATLKFNWKCTSLRLQLLRLGEESDWWLLPDSPSPVAFKIVPLTCSPFTLQCQVTKQTHFLHPFLPPFFWTSFSFFFFFIRWLEVSPKQKLTLFKQEGESWFYDVCPTRKGMAESGGERRKEREFCYLFINIMLVSICLFSDRRIYAICWVLLALCPFHSCPYWANIVAYN